MKKILIIGIIFLILIIIAAFAYYQEKTGNLVDNKNLGKNAEGGSDILIDNPKNESLDNFPIQVNESTGGLNSGGGSGSGNPETPGATKEEKQLPSDLNFQPCGFYFQEYGQEACGGACPEGECVTEGNSCYCKI